MGSCGDGTTDRITSRDGSPYTRQTDCHTQSGTVTATQPLPGWKSNQDCEGGSDPVLVGSLVGNSEQLEQDSAQLGKLEVGNKYAVHCTQTGHSKNKCTVAVTNNGLDWKGVVQEDKGLSINDIQGLKYCPGGELPIYTFV